MVLGSITQMREHGCRKGVAHHPPGTERSILRQGLFDQDLFDEAAAKCLGDGGGAIGRAELFEDVLEVGLDRVG